MPLLRQPVSYPDSYPERQVASGRAAERSVGSSLRLIDGGQCAGGHSSRVMARIDVRAGARARKQTTAVASEAVWTMGACLCAL